MGMRQGILFLFVPLLQVAFLLSPAYQSASQPACLLAWLLTIFQLILTSFVVVACFADKNKQIDLIINDQDMLADWHVWLRNSHRERGTERASM